MKKTKEKKEESIEILPSKEEWEKLLELPKLFRRLEERVVTTQQNLRQLKLKTKKLEKMNIIIAACNTQINKFNSIHLKVIRVAQRNEIKMEEIIKDYESLFKKWNTTITFYERRTKGGDWIPGTNKEEDEEYKVARSNKKKRNKQGRDNQSL